MSIRKTGQVLFAGAALSCTVPGPASTAEVLHSYGNSLGQEVINVIAVSSSKLRPLLPPGYTPVPAASVGFGGPDQGIVVIGNFRGIKPTVDGKRTAVEEQVAIDMVVLVAEPSGAAQAGVSIPGAFHVYALLIYTNDARYSASLRESGIPVELVSKIDYRRAINDETGVGTLSVNVPSAHSPLRTFNVGQGYSPAPAAFNTVFWRKGPTGTGMLHFLDQPFKQGTAIGRIYTQPGSKWDRLFSGGGLGPCDPDPGTGYHCIVAPALNMRYDEGSRGTLLLLKESDALKFRMAPK